MTPDDLRLRKNYIGGSDAPIIMEKSPWATPLDLWEVKIGLKPDFEGNRATDEGRRKEPIARKAFEEKTGLLMFPERRFSKEYEFMMATMDGVSLDGKHAVEIKCPGQEDHELALNGIIPEKYYPQLQHQICVLNLQMIFYFSFNGKENKIIEVPRDDAYISTLTGKEAEFFNEYLKKMIAPPLSDKDFVSRNDTKWLEKSLQWQRIIEQKQMWEEAEEKIRKELIELSEGHNTIGGGIRLTKVISKGNVNYSKIPQLKEIDLEEFRSSPRESWRLTPIRK
jgi:putative phage-type endonuclease